MSIQSILNNKENEIEIITKIITHPAAFHIGLFGELLTIRSHCDGYEVAWIDYADGVEIKSHKDFSPNCIEEAVKFFVEKRYEYQLGVDFETSLIECEHNWVLDGHHSGNTICSRCLVEDK